MGYVLILTILFSKGVTSLSHDFSSMENCEKAKAVLLENIETWHAPIIFCTDK